MRFSSNFNEDFVFRTFCVWFHTNNFYLSLLFADKVLPLWSKLKDKK